MAPSRPPAHVSNGAAVAGGVGADVGADDELFLEPMMGTPLAIYVEKDVPDRDAIVELISVSALTRSLLEMVAHMAASYALETRRADISRIQRCAIYSR